MKAPEKWCSGPCGRLLPRSAFHGNGLGYENGECKACHRVQARFSYRSRYRHDAAFREAECARKRAAWAAKQAASAAMGAA